MLCPSPLMAGKPSRQRPGCPPTQVEDFWRLYVHLRRPVDDRPTVCDYHVFREGIKPMWEDETNVNGGKWIVRLKKGVAARYWEDLVRDPADTLRLCPRRPPPYSSPVAVGALLQLLALVGGQFRVGDEICGAVLSVRYQEDILSVWSAAALAARAPTPKEHKGLRRRRLPASPASPGTPPPPPPRWQEQVCRQSASLHADPGHAALSARSADRRFARVQEAHRLDARQLLLPQRQRQFRREGRSPRAAGAAGGATTARGMRRRARARRGLHKHSRVSARSRRVSPARLLCASPRMFCIDCAAFLVGTGRCRLCVTTCDVRTRVSSSRPNK